MSAYIFKKETKGFSVTKDLLKASYGGISYRATGSVAKVAKIEFPGFQYTGVNGYSIDLNVDTVTIGVTPFAGTASALIDSLRDTVFFD